ncbi:hypothetical protein [Pseudobutyrivibrio sp.]|uniref:hypothetical protein n=1 Tax=Pseudobutyrivibrio sp. TaxID=2014367 RepID=UPI0025D85C8D|nr:hypothetical protein [Pseudobutyrivibrio sp.]MBR5649634.1 hypothetical protein [Pseudobutyrivibrio sp.]
MIEVLHQKEILDLLTTGMIVLAICFGILAIVLWFVFKIPHSIKVLTKIGASKDIQSFGNVRVSRTSNAVLNWNTSEMLDKNPEENIPESYEDEATILLEETILLQEENEQDVETSVEEKETGIESPKEKDKGFEIQEEIIITGTENDLPEI